MSGWWSRAARCRASRRHGSPLSATSTSAPGPRWTPPCSPWWATAPRCVRPPRARRIPSLESFPIVRRCTDEVGQKLTEQVLQTNRNEKDPVVVAGPVFADSGGPSLFKDGYVTTVTSYGYTNNCRRVGACSGWTSRPCRAGWPPWASGRSRFGRALSRDEPCCHLAGEPPTTQRIVADHSRPQRPSSLARKPPVRASSGGQLHRSLFGTPRSTCSTCWPQPAKVALPQVRQVAGRHIGWSSWSVLGRVTEPQHVGQAAALHQRQSGVLHGGGRGDHGRREDGCTPRDGESGERHVETVADTPWGISQERALLRSGTAGTGLPVPAPRRSRVDRRAAPAPSAGRRSPHRPGRDVGEAARGEGADSWASPCAIASRQPVTMRLQDCDGVPPGDAGRPSTTSATSVGAERVSSS